MLINLKEILQIAEDKKFAIPAFNVYNLETVMGVLKAAEDCNSPVIMQGYSRLFTNGEAYFMAPIVLAAAKATKVPICFHLDHGAGYPEVAKAVRYGCTGIMIDGSLYDFEKNVATTKAVCDICNGLGVPVEGELGHVGSTKDDSMCEYTHVDEAKEFVERTGVSALAVMVGTAHGRYKKAPKLDIERIKEIKEATGTPLVLHGGSGVPDEEIKAAVAAGIRKVNFSTDLCYSFLDTIFETSREVYALDLFMKDATAAVSEFAKSKIKLLGAENKV